MSDTALYAHQGARDSLEQASGSGAARKRLCAASRCRRPPARHACGARTSPAYGARSACRGACGGSSQVGELSVQVMLQGQLLTQAKPTAAAVLWGSPHAGTQARSHLRRAAARGDGAQVAELDVGPLRLVQHVGCRARQRRAGLLVLRQVLCLGRGVQHLACRAVQVRCRLRSAASPPTSHRKQRLLHLSHGAGSLDLLVGHRGVGR